MSSSPSDAAREQVTGDARNQDALPHETTPAETGPHDLVDPSELTEGSADGDAAARTAQKRAGDY